MKQKQRSSAKIAEQSININSGDQMEKEFRICAGCDKEFIPTLSKRLCRDCKTETDAVYEELMKKEK